MRRTFYTGLDDRNTATEYWTTSHSVPPADHTVAIPHPSPDRSKKLRLPRPPTMGKENENIEINVGGIVMDLAEDGCKDNINTPTKKDARKIPPARARTDSGIILPASTVSESLRSPPGRPRKQTCLTLEKPTDPEQVCTMNHDQPATRTLKSCSSDNSNTEEEQLFRYLVECLSLDSNCDSMFNDNI